MSAVPPIIATDRECLEAYSRRPGAESLRPAVERYVAFVYASAQRRTGDAVHAAEVTRAVFLVLARRARKLPKKTVLAGWLYDQTQGYGAAVLIAAGVNLLGALLAMRLPAPAQLKKPA